LFEKCKHRKIND